MLSGVSASETDLEGQLRLALCDQTPTSKPDTAASDLKPAPFLPDEGAATGAPNYSRGLCFSLLKAEIEVLVFGDDWRRRSEAEMIVDADARDVAVEARRSCRR